MDEVEGTTQKVVLVFNLQQVLIGLVGLYGLVMMIEWLFRLTKRDDIIIPVRIGEDDDGVCPECGTQVCPTCGSVENRAGGFAKLMVLSDVKEQLSGLLRQLEGTGRITSAADGTTNTGSSEANGLETATAAAAAAERNEKMDGQ